MATRIVITEHNPVESERLCDEIECISGHEVAGTAHDAWEAIEVVGRLKPDLLLLRMEVPGLNTLEVLQIVQWHSPSTKVIVLSSQDEESTVFELLKLGALGYIVDGDGAILRKAILAVQSGETWARRRVMAVLIDELIRLAQPTCKHGEHTSDVRGVR